MARRWGMLLAVLAFGAGIWLGAVLDQYRFFDPATDRLVVIATWDWAAIGAIMTAAATVVLAYFAIQASRTAAKALAAANKQAIASSAAAQAASDAVVAANREADASAAVVEEMRLDRQVQFRPHLTLTSGLISGTTATLQVRNVGSGPALRCLAAMHTFFERSGHQWSVSGDFDLAAGEQREIEVREAENETRPRLLTETPALMAEGQVFAVAYEDLLGSRYRARLRAKELQTDSAPRTEQGTAPDWATWVERR